MSFNKYNGSFFFFFFEKEFWCFTLIYDFCYQFVDSLICLQMSFNLSKNIIYNLWNQVDAGMPHQFALSIFHLVVTTCGTGLV